MKHLLLPIVALTAVSFTAVALAREDRPAAPVAQAAPASAAMPQGHVPTTGGTMPKGHPPVDAAEGPDASAANLPNEGKVTDVKDAGGYTYVEVTYKGKTRWLAAPQTAVTKGAVVRYGTGSVMHDFFSKTMNRNFPEIIFLDRVVVVSSGDKK